MMRWAAIAALLLFMVSPVAAQFTIVTGTVKDVNGLAYAGANSTISASLVVPGGTSPTLNGVGFTGVMFPIGLDSTGSFTARLADNNVILPSGTQWQFQVNTNGVPQPVGTGPQTCIAIVTITGAAQSVSSSLSACPALTNPGSGGGPPGITSVGLQTPPDLTVTNSPVIPPGGTLTTAWSPQFSNMILASGGQNSIAGVFDGVVTGQTISAQTSITLTATPKTTHDVAFFVSDEDRSIGQSAPPNMTGSGTWTSVVTNGNFGATYQQLLTTSSPLTATANEGTATNWAAGMFFLTTNGGTPAIVQTGNAGGILSCGNPGGQPTAFTTNTVIGHSILAIIQGLPSSSNLSFSPILDTQGNVFTPITVVQNQTKTVIAAWLATNIVGATMDSVSVFCQSGQTIQGSFAVVELSNLLSTTGIGFRYMQYGDVTPFMQAGITNSTTCPTAAAAGSTCTFTENWPIRWRDGSYAVSCSGAGTITGEPVIEGVAKTASTAVVTVVNITAVAANYGEMDCIGVRPIP
jgi:hypothetical protein